LNDEDEPRIIGVHFANHPMWQSRRKGGGTGGAASGA